MEKIKVIHFHNGTGGGVLSVIRNLLLYRQHTGIENQVIFTINKEQIPYFEKPSLEGAAREHVFYYSPNWNFYYTCKKLAELLPNDKAIIVAHDWLELGMVSNLGLQNPVIHYVHGAYDYYYNLAFKHRSWVDRYIVVSHHIEKELTKLIPDRISHINYLRFPIPDIKCESEKSNSELNIVFVGRCEESKGYPLLPKIENELLRRGIKVKWHIAGEDSTDINKKQLWPTKSTVTFYGFLSQNDVKELLCKSQLFILPSIAEGMPVSVIEAMKAGCLPIVNDLQSGVTELVINDVNGYIVKNNDVYKYADVIEKISKSDDLVYQMSIGAKAHILNLFDPKINTNLIEDIFLKKNIIQKKLPKKEYGSSLDFRYLPNFVTYSLRKCLILLKQCF